MEELIHNSLKAGSCCIVVRLDISKLKLQVVDTGEGISASDLAMVGQRYRRSKCHSLEDLDKLRYYGYEGEALASIIHVAGAAEVSIHHRLSEGTFSKKFHHSKGDCVKKRSAHRTSPGITVIIISCNIGCFLSYCLHCCTFHNYSLFLLKFCFISLLTYLELVCFLIACMLASFHIYCVFFQ